MDSRTFHMMKINFPKSTICFLKVLHTENRLKQFFASLDLSLERDFWNSYNNCEFYQNLKVIIENTSITIHTR